MKTELIEDAGTESKTVHIARPRWMVVDDNEDLSRLIKLILTTVTDAEICCFRNGEEALHAMETAPECFQLAITDFDMPGMNGSELCQRLHNVAPDLDVILSTGNLNISEEETVRDGFRGMVHKPFTFASLREVVKTVQSEEHKNLSLQAA